MRFIRYVLFAVLLAGVAAPIAQADLIVTIPLDTYTPTATGGTFRVRVTATPTPIGGTSFDAFNLRLQATAFLGGIALPITMTSESALPSGWAALTGPFDPVPNNSITAVGSQFGMSAFGPTISLMPGASIDIAQFSFQVADLNFNPGEAWVVDFVSGNPSINTGFAAAGMNVPFAALPQTLAQVPEPSTFALVGVAAAMALGWRRRKKSQAAEADPTQEATSEVVSA
jgi:hypothetical protein